MNAIIRGIALATASIALLSADTLYLRDGRTIQGTFIGGNSRDIRFLEQGRSTQRYPISSVRNVIFGDGSASTSSNSSIFGNPNDSRDRNDSRYRNNDPQYRDNASRARTASIVIPANATVTVRMIDSIDSDANSAGQTFRASLDEPIIVNGRTVADRGADATVKIVRVQQGGKITGQEEVTAVLNDVMINGRRYTVNSGDATVASNAKGSQSAKVIGGTAVVGAIIGAIAGGGKGAAIGAAAGAGTGAAIQAIRGQRVQIPSESKLDFTLNDPVYVD